MPLKVANVDKGSDKAYASFSPLHTLDDKSVRSLSALATKHGAGSLMESPAPQVVAMDKFFGGVVSTITELADEVRSSDARLSSMQQQAAAAQAAGARRAST